MSEAQAPVQPPTLVQKLAAEAIGTFVLVLFGVGAAAAGSFGDGDYAATGLAFGIAIVVMVYSFGRISGGHFNPAVSVGAALSGRVAWKDAGAYIGAQVLGALLGGLVLGLILVAGDTGWEFGDYLGANRFGEDGFIDLAGALLIEIVMTFVFLIVILAVTDSRNEHPALAPLAIGLTLAAIHFASMWATATSVNPARSLGVAFFSGGDSIADVWLFVVAPLIGAALAGLAYPALFGHGTDPVPGSGFNFSSSRQGVAAGVPGYGAPDQYQQQWNQPGAQPAWGSPQQGSPQQGSPQHGAAQHGAPQQGATQQPWEQSAQPAAAQPAQEQPIIQDGWQWDPQSQQWIPAQQQPPAGGWSDPDTGGDRTQVRPPDGT